MVEAQDQEQCGMTDLELSLRNSFEDKDKDRGIGCTEFTRENVHVFESNTEVLPMNEVSIFTIILLRM